MKAKSFMKTAIEEAKKGVMSNNGGPFGAVIVKDDRIIATAHNEVLKTKDPTAHAEILAIRTASQVLGSFDLSGCYIYSTCEPCPMCLSAILWARISRLYYGCTSEDAARIGFSDELFYKYFKGDEKTKNLIIEQTQKKECCEVFKTWEDKKDKIIY